MYVQKGKFYKVLKNLDFFPKSAEEVKDKTSAGGLISVIAAVLIVFLLYGETQEYLTSQTTSSVWVDTTVGGEMMIYFDFTFTSLRCDQFQLDLVDESGGHKPVTGISYRPVNGDAEWQDSWLAHAFQRRGFFTGGPDAMTGCSVSGQISADKTKGNLHIAAGQGTSQVHSGGHAHHIHRLQPSDITSTFNVTHRINWLNFGTTYPGKNNPLAMHKFLHETNDKYNYQINYLIKLVPTVYEDASGEQKNSYQFSVSEHKALIDYTKPNFPLPGVFFKWDISAYLIKQKEVGTTFPRFLIRVCAVLGGSFVVFGLVLRTLNRAYNVVKDKDH